MKNKILLIDDDNLVSKTLKKLLEKHGYEVETAPNAVDAVTAVAVKDFNLVISDIRMPGENGIIAIQKIKHVYEQKSVYCAYMFITGYAEEDTPEHAVKLGVNRFIFKPFENADFLAAVKDELELLHAEIELKHPTKEAPVVITKKPLSEKIPTRRAVITGIGAVSPNGIGREEYWRGLRAGKNCVDNITF